MSSTEIFLPVESIFIALMLPGLDMLRVFSVRIYNKKNPFLGDRNHLHHLLIEKNIRNNLLLFIFFLLISIPIFLDLFLKIDHLSVIILFIIIYFLLFFF